MQPARRPYDELFDVEQLRELEDILPGSADRVLTMIQTDMTWQSERQDRLDSREHTKTLLLISVAAVVVLVIAGLSTWVILEGHSVAGSILASVDLVALASAFLNALKRN
jgi:uncharacterized membrane protein